MAVRLDKDRYTPKMPGVDEALRKRIMYAYGVSQRALMPDPRAPHVRAPLDARALAAACGLRLRRAKACLRGYGTAWPPHMEARRIVACGDLVLAGHVPGPGELVEAVPPVDFQGPGAGTAGARVHVDADRAAMASAWQRSMPAARSRVVLCG